MPDSFVGVFPSYGKSEVTGIEEARLSVFPRSSPGNLLDSNPNQRTDHSLSQKHFIVAIDFGTTFSAVAFAVLQPGDRREDVPVDAIEYIEHYPDAPGGVLGEKREIPTESCYLKLPIRRDESLFLFHPEIEQASELESDDSGEEDEAKEVAKNSDNEMDIDIDLPHGEDSRYHEDSQGEDHEDEAVRYLWGYSVHEHFKFPDADCENYQKISRSKLILDNSKHTRALRRQLKDSVDELKNRGTVRNGMDLIIDYLAQLLIHTKDQLRWSHGFNEQHSVEFVLCVPVVWKREACRLMQSALKAAVLRSNFGKVVSDSVENLYIVSEPEAAAARVLETSLARDIQNGDAFLLLDAGGGTVDAITYKLADKDQLQLEREAVGPEGVLAGSSYLNENCRRILDQRLEPQTDLESDTTNISKAGLIESVVYDFENLKRTLDINKETTLGIHFPILGLKPCREKKFRAHRLTLDRHDLKQIFRPPLEMVASLMRRQLEAARRKGVIVKKVILTGGFAASPSLRGYLEKDLYKIAQEFLEPIGLVAPKLPEVAVASGAVLRALRRHESHSRIIQSSYGFLITEVYEPETIAAHLEIRKPRRDKLDNERYVKNTLTWLVNKGDEVSPFKPFKQAVCHTFPARRNQKFICREVLYVSDSSHESHYKKDHPKNAGNRPVGEIIADMTFLRTNRHIKPVKGMDEYGKPLRQRHYQVKYDIVMTIDGYNIKYEARWKNDMEERVIGAKQINIQAAFVSLEPEDSHTLFTPEEAKSFLGE